MKKIIVLVIGLLLITGCGPKVEDPNNLPQPKVPDEPETMKTDYVSYNGPLKVKGKDIVNQYNEKIQLKGISSHGLQWFDYLITDENIKTIKSWGANTIRLAMYTKEGGYIDNKAIYDNLIKDIDLVIANDMYVIIDWHILSDNNPNIYKDEAKEFFTNITNKYKYVPNVIYEICNEPNGATSWDDVRIYAEEIVPIIRKNTNSIIIVGTPSFSQDVDKVIGNRVGFENIMYALHFYAGTHKDDLRNKVQNALNNDIPIFVSEWGTSNADGNGGPFIEESNKWMEFINKNNLSYINWSLADKDEKSALLLPNNTVVSDDTLSESGKYIKSILSK